MDEKTCIRQVEVRRHRRRIQPPVNQPLSPVTNAELMVLSEKPKGLKMLLNPENLTKNLAMVGCFSLIVLALQQVNVQQDTTVFSALSNGLSARWDEDVGKLSFVTEMLPPEIRAVWNPSANIQILPPVQGQVVHAWSAAEPYVEMKSTVNDIRSAGTGEVMSVAHGLNDEKVIRIRHNDGSETLYGNLQTTFVEVGSYVESGDIIATLLPESPLAFELKVGGRSIDPVPCMAEQPQ